MFKIVICKVKLARQLKFVIIVTESIEDPQVCVIDIDSLARTLANSIVSREYLESRHNTVEDNGLIGLLNLMTIVIKHFPPFKTSKDGQEFLLQVSTGFFFIQKPNSMTAISTNESLSG